MFEHVRPVNEVGANAEIVLGKTSRRKIEIMFMDSKMQQKTK
jgi:hypothetical protein